MKILRNFLDKIEPHFTEGKLKRAFPLYEAMDSFLYTPGTVTKAAPHIRDGLDLKRLMITVVYAMIPAVIFALYNTGYHAAKAFAANPDQPLLWQTEFALWLGLTPDPASVAGNILLGSLYFLPVYIVTLAAGGFWEVVFAVIRKHEINEGFLVTSLLFPMILPPAIPLWQVAIGISFGIVIGKEIFGGVGMNVLNPALVSRAFLFFAYPAEISGDAVWVAADGISQATPLAEMADTSLKLTATWWDSFIGLIPGSMGETSALACLIGAIVLIATGVASWRIMLSIVAGTTALSLLFNFIGSSTNPMFGITPEWHFVLGGFAFGTVFMATDPVSAAVTRQGQYIYGLMIGFLVVLVRVINPAFPEGMMLAILLANVFSSVIDRYFIQKNIKRRLAKHVS